MVLVTAYPAEVVNIRLYLLIAGASFFVSQIESGFNTTAKPLKSCAELYIADCSCDESQGSIFLGQIGTARMHKVAVSLHMCNELHPLHKLGSSHANPLIKPGRLQKP